MKAFHGDKKIKAKYVARVKAHQKLDEIIKGRYWENGKGCAVGCTIEGSEHLRYETELGIPEILAHLEDGLFEEMSNKDAMKFPLKFLKAIPVGADLSKVFTKLVIWEWEDKKHGLKNIKEIKDDAELYDCCEKVVILYKRVLNNKKVSDSEWIALENLADKIYEARAEAEAGAWAWARAWAGTRAWARAWAGTGAWAWARAGTGARARAEYEKQILITSKQLIKLLKDAPIIKK